MFQIQLASHTYRKEHQKQRCLHYCIIETKISNFFFQNTLRLIFLKFNKQELSIYFKKIYENNTRNDDRRKSV